MRPLRDFAPCLVVVVQMVCFARSGFATGTKLWTIQSAADLEAGTAESVSISALGELALAPAITELGDADAKPETTQPYIWSLAEDAAGTIYAGTGNGGKVLRVGPDGELSVLVDTPEVAILCLELGPDGALYAGTTPDGLVYRIDLGESEPTPQTIFSEGETYVWDLLFDEQAHLFAATGGEGKLYRISSAPDSPGEFTSEVVFDAQQSHLMSLLLDDGAILAGSDGSGLIYRIDPADPDSAFVVYDTDETEVRSLVRLASGDILASTAAGRLPRPPGVALMDPPAGEQRDIQSHLYRVDTAGVAHKVWSSDGEMILAVAPFGERVLLGTGDDGEVLAVRMDGHATTLGKVEAAQVLAMLRRADDIVLATGNPGALHTIGAGVAPEGSWTSDVFDASIVSQWGTVRWAAAVPEGTSVEISTRSGNTNSPDSTWSEWVATLAVASEYKVANRSARFIQMRVTLRSADPSSTPVVRLVELAYLQANLEPMLSGMSVESVGDENGANGSRLKSAKDASLRASWSAEDPNEDTLEYAVFYRSEGGSSWHLLEEELTAPNHSWDDAAMPDGDYRLKVVATDRLSNPSQRALSSELIGEPFRVDNGQPILSAISAQRVDSTRIRLAFTATDATSYIAEAAFALNAGDWQVAFPSDDLFDSRTEIFDVSIDGVTGDEHTIAIRSSDAAGNVAVARITVD